MIDKRIWHAASATPSVARCGRRAPQVRITHETNRVECAVCLRVLEAQGRESPVAPITLADIRKMPNLKVSYRQLDHWVRRGYIHTVGGGGEGFWRVLTSPDEARVAAVMAQLVEAGFTPDHAAIIARRYIGTRRSAGEPAMIKVAPGITLTLSV